MLIAMLGPIVDPEGYERRQREAEAQRLQEQEEERLEQLTQAEAEAEERRSGFHCLSGWDGSNRSMVEQVRAVMRNPSSFEHVETAIYPNDKGEHGVWMTFRAENGFGGMNVERRYGRIDHETCNARVLPDGPGSG